MFSQTSEYALRAMVTLAARPDVFLSAPEIAQLTHVPLNYLSKILQLLAKASLLKKKRGIKGGYSLQKSPKEISIFSIIEPFDSISRIESCPLKLKEHTGALCPLHSKLDQLACFMRRELGSVTLEDLTQNPKRPLCLQ